MPIIASIDGNVSPRLVYLHADTVGTTVNPIDIYKEMRTLRSVDESLRKFDLFMKASGNDTKGAGKFTERYVTLLNTRIVPFNTNHVLTINGTLITDDGFEGIYAFDKSPLSSSTSVDIAYIPPQVEIIIISTGSAVTTQDKIDIASQAASRVWGASTRLLTSDGSGGATAQEVWQYGNRQLTVASGLTTSQENRLNSVPTALQNAEALMASPIPENTIVGSWGEFFKNKVLTLFKFKAYK